MIELFAILLNYRFLCGITYKIIIMLMEIEKCRQNQTNQKLWPNNGKIRWKKRQFSNRLLNVLVRFSLRVLSYKNHVCWTSHNNITRSRFQSDRLIATWKKSLYSSHRIQDAHLSKRQYEKNTLLKTRPIFILTCLVASYNTF